jgi:hypothetical protein
VQPAGHRVRLAVELAARVQHGEDDLDRRALLGRMHVDRHTAAVVDDPHATVREQHHLDVVSKTGKRLVDGVVHDLPHQVVQAALDVDPMYMPGRLRTAVRPSRTVIELLS